MAETDGGDSTSDEGMSVKLKLRWPRGLPAVLVIGALAPALLGLGWFVADAVDSPLQADAAPEPIVVPVGAGTREQPTSALIAVEQAGPFQVTSGGTGLVTEVRVEAGDEVQPGDRLIAVDDQDRVAFSAPAPLWRDLRLGDEGADVDRVREFLADLDLPSGTVAGRVTPATAEGIRQLNVSLGRGHSDQVLHRESLLWIGPESMAIHTVLVRVGDAVSAGSPVFEGPDRPAAAMVEVSEERPWLEEDYVLAVGDTTVPYDPRTGRLDDPEAVSEVAEAVGDQDEGAGTVRLADPQEVGTLPAAAVVTDEQGQTCVFEDVAAAPTPVEVSGGSLSTVEVPVDWAGRPVLINPREVREDLSCG